LATYPHLCVHDMLQRDRHFPLFDAQVFCIIQGILKRMVRFQKLTRNLFLTLQGHNVHRQQRQLSKFLMHYQQFPSHAYCGAAGPVSKMASQQEKASCVLRFEVSRSMITVQREFHARFRKDANFLLTFETAPFFCVYPVQRGNSCFSTIQQAYYVKRHELNRSEHRQSRVLLWRV
jgi:hypothetical protein